MSNISKIAKPWSIALIYLVLGIAWIFFSDKAAEYLFSDNIREMSKFQLTKGISYVLVTSFLLYILIKSLYDQVNSRKQELELLFTNPNLGILKLDEFGYITYVSENTSKLTGYLSSELINKHIIHFTPEEWKEMDLEELNQISNTQDREGFIFNKHLQSKSGEMIIIKAYGIKVFDEKEKKTSYIAAFQNITDQVHFLNRLESQNKSLKEIAFQQSHLVRAPLARILGITNVLDDCELTESEKMDLVKSLHDSSAELDQALKDISEKMKRAVDQEDFSS
ncbi:PAS domain-containing protein [Algoriphagus aestuarii]|nr:PAS domain-containing protein [Algoriphagus aestuarii]